MKNSASEPKSDSLWQKSQFANLVRYIPSGTYYARLRVKGKLIKKSLGTTSITVAKMKLADVEKEEREKAERLGGRKVSKLTFGDVLALYRENGFRPLVPKKKKDLIRLKPKALAYYAERAKALQKFWPEPDLENAPMTAITVEQLNAWSRNYLAEQSATGHNHTLGMLRNLFDIAVERGAIYRNPARQIMRATEKPKKMILPTREQFEAFLLAIEGNGAGKQRHCANLVRFMAYGGFRKGEVPHITWADCDFTKGTIRVLGDPETGTKGTEERIRFVPMIGQMREFLERLRESRKGEPLNAAVMKVFEAEKAMTRAAGEVGMERVTHHDLRHLFVTRCLESGVSAPVVGKWCGHRDNGITIMRVYGHIIDEHSHQEARKVSFASKEPENVVPIPMQKAEGL